jgi:hypothetical protein
MSSTADVEPTVNSGQYELGIRKTTLGSSIENEPLNDPLIYPGLYAPSGIDMMGILVCCAFSLVLISFISIDDLLSPENCSGFLLSLLIVSTNSLFSFSRTQRSPLTVLTTNRFESVLVQIP